MYFREGGGTSSFGVLPELAGVLAVGVLEALGPKDWDAVTLTSTQAQLDVTEQHGHLCHAWLRHSVRESRFLDAAQEDADLQDVFLSVDRSSVEAKGRRAVLRSADHARAFSRGIAAVMNTERYDGQADDLFLLLRGAAADGDDERCQQLAAAAVRFLGAETIPQTALLRDAVLAGDLLLCKALVAMGADADDGSLVVAAYLGRKDIIFFLAEHARVEFWAAFDPHLRDVLAQAGTSVPSTSVLATSEVLSQ